MAKCSERRWTSELRPSGGSPINDGRIKIDPEAADGKFKGHHENTGGLITGTCTESSDDCSEQNPCHITFSRRAREGNSIYEYNYDGDFVKYVNLNKYRTRNGSYTKVEIDRVDMLADARAVIRESGEWIGERPIT